MRQLITCDCGEWTFRELGLFTGLGVAERHCPRCGRAMLIVFRGADHIATVPLPGRDRGSVEQALMGCALTSNEVRVLVTVAELMAS
ncbi:MAG TPA: hypothetical protein VLH75_07260 [Longimicrobiales bacterium]|nr:hypothetical protein [Longimicrobiales bacterium]